MYNRDTIAAISTPCGEGAIGIVRLSGSNALKIISTLFKPKNKNSWKKKKTHTLHFGTLVFKGIELDEVVVSLMKSPNSYTGEDIVEINCHGGWVILSKILEAVCAMNARLAEPGEFTKRAFLNEKLELSQAEAVVDLIKAKTDTAAGIALKQLKGTGYKKIKQLNTALIECMANIEANLDFSDQNLDVEPVSKTVKRLEKIKTALEAMIENARKANLFKLGLHITIVGRTNVGKSSLANRLMKNRKIIVTSLPGTTRDVIEEVINICGIPVVIADTAGIRKHSGKIEEIGQRMTREKVKVTDVVLAVFDLSRRFTPDDKEIMRHIRGKKGILLFNKADITCRMNKNRVRPEFPHWPEVEISAKTGRNIKRLKEEIYKLTVGDSPVELEETFISNIRQLEALKFAYISVKDALKALKKGFPEDIAAIEIKEALNSIGKITGETTDEEILTSIFSKFCVGK
ncbi:MAG: tRNA uridine-5-carboxymethylaminomethyl(34) synthesis GTPase MnmE [Candidatus Aureabacteria bacterium]|nr:tRNA uridine-5-carboxymethylaminomethyl(34) synthesis GTPase MnmE [Candidatus Auribacterota bacterium]